MEPATVLIIFRGEHFDDKRANDFFLGNTLLTNGVPVLKIEACDDAAVAGWS